MLNNPQNTLDAAMACGTAHDDFLLAWAQGFGQESSKERYTKLATEALKRAALAMGYQLVKIESKGEPN